jgi:hypothetical protein
LSNSNLKPDRIKSFVRNPARKSEKRNSAKQIIKESRVCNYLACYAEDVNHILARAGEPIIVGLEFEEANKAKAINLRRLDPIAADYVKSLEDKIAFANRKMLKSFRLKLSIQEVAA